jgi:predicted CoA-binding protein
MSTDVMQPRIARFLKSKRIALVGATNKKEKWGYKILKALQAKGYDVVPVHPALDRIESTKVFPSLRDLPAKPDAVSLVVPPSATEDAVRDCQAIGVTQVWMQPGAESDEAIDLCEAAGIDCIHHRCVLVEMGAAH